MGLTDLAELEIAFEGRVVQFNKKLKESAEVTQGITFLPIKGWHFDTSASLQVDGLHLNDAGTERLRVALRKAVLVDLHRCRSREF